MSPSVLAQGMSGAQELGSRHRGLKYKAINKKVIQIKIFFCSVFHAPMLKRKARSDIIKMVVLKRLRK